MSTHLGSPLPLNTVACHECDSVAVFILPWVVVLEFIWSARLNSTHTPPCHRLQPHPLLHMTELQVQGWWGTQIIFTVPTAPVTRFVKREHISLRIFILTPLCPASPISRYKYHHISNQLFKYPCAYISSESGGLLWRLSSTTGFSLVGCTHLKMWVSSASKWQWNAGSCQSHGNT